MQAAQLDLYKLTQRFHFHVTDAEQEVLSFQADELAQKESMERLMQTYAPLIQALEPAAAATYTGGALRYLIFAQQSAISICNQSLDLSPGNLQIQLLYKNGYHFFGFRLKQWVVQDGPVNLEERHIWRKEVLTALYGTTLRPIMEQMADTVSVPIAQLWGQLSNGRAYFLDHMLSEVEDSSIRERVHEDLEFLQKGLEPAVFGRKRNPFNVTDKMVEHSTDPQKQMPLKTACCLYYRTVKEIYCYTCPKLSKEQRAARLAEIRSAAQ